MDWFTEKSRIRDLAAFEYFTAKGRKSPDKSIDRPGLNKLSVLKSNAESQTVTHSVSS
jgi:hypothetical protein